MNAAPLLIAASLIFSAGFAIGRACAALRAFKEGVREGYHEAWCDSGANEAVWTKLRAEVQREAAREGRQ